MAVILLAAFIAIPVIEIAAFIEIGSWIGLWSTIGVVIATAVAGSVLLRLQGLAVLRRFRESMLRNEIPVTEVFDGLCLLVAGAFLLTPGFFTDLAGFALMIPPFRRWVARGLLRGLAKRGHVVSAAASVGPDGWSGDSGGRDGAGPVIDGEFEEIERKSGARDRRLTP